MKPFHWTPVRDRAAMLTADDTLSDEKMVAQLGISRRALVYWRLHPEFQARVAEHLDAWKTKVRNQGIALREKRLEALNHRENLMRQVIAERAASVEMADAPGGTTGLLVKTYKVVGNGPNAQMVTEFAVDTGLLSEMRQHEKQAAQELGQWIEKGEIRGSKDAPITVEHIGADRINAAERAFLAALGLESAGVGDPESVDHSPDAGTDPVLPV